MAKMGKYCKAYPMPRLREYPKWSEKLENVRFDKRLDEDGRETDEEYKRELTDEEFLYLQENYVVTDGIYLDENVIFDDVTEEWKRFCTETLKFEVPVWEPVKIKDDKLEAEGALEEDSA